jgi:hypothetical protein
MANAEAQADNSGVATSTASAGQGGVSNALSKADGEGGTATAESVSLDSGSAVSNATSTVDSFSDGDISNAAALATSQGPGASSEAVANANLNGRQGAAPATPVVDTSEARATANSVGPDSKASATANTTVCGVGGITSGSGGSGGVCGGSDGNDTHGLSVAIANADPGGQATAQSNTLAQAGGTADATTNANATNGGIANSISGAQALGGSGPVTCTGGGVPPCGAGSLPVQTGSSDAQARSITQANGTGSIANAQSNSVSFEAGANTLSVSQANNGGIATTNTIASDIAGAGASGTGISVAGGCKVFAGCGFAIAQTGANLAGIPDTSQSISVAVSQANNLTGVGAVALSSPVGGNGVNAPATSTLTPGVGGSFSFQNNTGTAATVAAVGMQAGMTGPAVVPFP